MGYFSSDDWPITFRPSLTSSACWLLLLCYGLCLRLIPWLFNVQWHQSFGLLYLHPIMLIRDITGTYAAPFLSLCFLGQSGGDDSRSEECPSPTKILQKFYDLLKSSSLWPSCDGSVDENWWSNLNCGFFASRQSLQFLAESFNFRWRGDFGSGNISCIGFICTTALILLKTVLIFSSLFFFI